MQYGYFDSQRREYVIDRVDVPVSWTNYLGVEDLCAVLNHTAGGYMFHKSPEHGRVTRFRPNGVPMDRPGHYIYLRDDDTGEYWTVSWQPCSGDLADYRCRHGLSYSVYECRRSGISASQTMFIPRGEAVELWDVTLQNRSGRPRRLSVYSYVEFSFHQIPIDNQNFQMSLYCAGCDCEDGMLALLWPLLWLAVRFFRRRVSRPMEVLMEGARQIEGGNLGYQVEAQTSSQEFTYLSDSFNRMSCQLKAQFERLYREEIALRDAHIKALQAHINPHFLNNSLEIINWEARMSGNQSVSRMIEALSTVLDAALDRKKSPEVTLREEMRYVDAYLYIITQRFGSRLSVCVEIPEALLSCRVPRLILQPVIENAVEHGIRPNGRGVVSLRARRDGGFLLLEVCNDGGLSDADEAHIRRLLSPDYDARGESSGNIGIANVNQRLRILYGPACGLRIERGEGTLVTATLTVELRAGGTGDTL